MSKLSNQELIERINKRIELAEKDSFELEFVRAIPEVLRAEITPLNSLIWDTRSQARNAQQVVKGRRPIYRKKWDAVQKELGSLRAENEKLQAENKKLMDQKFEYEVETGILKD